MRVLPEMSTDVPGRQRPHVHPDQGLAATESRNIKLRVLALTWHEAASGHEFFGSLGCPGLLDNGSHTTLALELDLHKAHGCEYAHKTQAENSSFEDTEIQNKLG